MNSVLKQLYEPGASSPFGPYPMSEAFGHGIPHTIAVVASKSAYGANCVVKEERWPASFYTAHVSSSEGSVLFSTGSGTEIGTLLKRVCDAFSAGAARLGSDDDSDSSELKVYEATCEDGRRTVRSLTANGKHEVHVDETANVFGAPKSAMAVYFDDSELADAVAAAIADGMLDIEHPKAKRLSAFAD